MTNPLLQKVLKREQQLKNYDYTTTNKGLEIAKHKLQNYDYTTTNKGLEIAKHKLQIQIETTNYELQVQNYKY
jgi:hypothetical protein